MIQPVNRKIDILGELRKALGILFEDGQVIEVRALGKFATYSGYFKDTERLIRDIEVLDTDPSLEGIYIVLNSIDPSLFARRANRVTKLGRNEATTGDSNILRRRWFPIDIDPKRASGISSSKEEHDSSLQKADIVTSWLRDIGFPEPIIADSGNGAHLLYRIDLPNTDQERDLIKKCIESIAFFHSDESCVIDTTVYNAARIWKLYGTVARKGDSIPERPHRRSHLVSIPEKVGLVEREVLMHLISLLPAPEYTTLMQSEHYCTEVDFHGKKRLINLREWLSEHDIAVRKEKILDNGVLFELDQCPFSDEHRGGAYAIQFSNGNIFVACHHNSCGGGTQRWSELRERYGDMSQERRSPPVSLPDSAQRDTQLSVMQECKSQAVETSKKPISDDSYSKVDKLKNDWISLQILQCVERLKPSYGRNKIAEILTGGKYEYIYKNGHHKSCDYGALKGISVREIKLRIDELISAGYLRLTADYMPRVLLTASAQAFLEAPHFCLNDSEQMDSTAPSKLVPPVHNEERGSTLHNSEIKLTNQDIDELFLLCIHSIEEKNEYLFGREHVVKILVGSSDRKVLQYNHNEFEVFGKGRNYEKKELMQYLDKLIREGYIEQVSNGLIRVLKTTADGQKYLALLRPDGDEKTPAKNIQELIEDLSSIDYSKRRNAAEALGDYGDCRAVDPLIQILSDRDQEVVYAGIIALTKLRDPKAVGPLLLLLDHSEIVVTGMAIDALGEIGDRRAYERIVRFLYSDDPDIVESALEAIGKLRDPLAYERIVNIYKTNTKIDQLSVIRALNLLGDSRGSEVCISLLHNNDPYIREVAAEALGELGGIGAVDPLIQCLDDLSSKVRSASVRSLGLLGFVKSIEPLKALLDDENEIVRKEAKDAIGIIGGRKL